MKDKEKILAKHTSDKQLVARMYKELSQLKKDKIANQKKKKRGRFRWWLSGKESACHCGKHRSIPGSERSPWTKK